jgi:hypothetical protein
MSELGMSTEIESMQCQVFEQFPVSDNWTTDLSGAHTNFILNYSAFLMAWSALDLALDVIILCMPVFVIKTLHLETRRKFSLIGIFALGGLYGWPRGFIFGIQ